MAYWFPFEELVENSHVVLDEETQTVKITEKCKQEALKTIDTNFYNVKFTDDVMEVSSNTHLGLVLLQELIKLFIPKRCKSIFR